VQAALHGRLVQQPHQALGPRHVLNVCDGLRHPGLAAQRADAQLLGTRAGGAERHRARPRATRHRRGQRARGCGDGAEPDSGTASSAAIQ